MSIHLAGGLQLIGVPSSLAYAAQFVVALVVVVFVCRLWRSASSQQLKLGGLLSAIWLVPPYGMSYDLVIIAVACIALLREMRNSEILPYERVIVLAAWLLPILGPFFNSRSFPMPISPLVLLALFSCVIRRSRHSCNVRMAPAST